MDKNEAIDHFGGFAAYTQQNDEALAALGALMRAAEGHSIQAVANAALLVTVTMMRGCGANIEEARRLVLEAWDNEMVRSMLKELRHGA